MQGCAVSPSPPPSSVRSSATDTRKDGGRAAARPAAARRHAHGVELVVFPELALTTFFPRWFVDDIAEADHYYERSMPNADTQPLFDEAHRLGIGFCLGYAELDRRRATAGTCRPSSSATARSSPRTRSRTSPATSTTSRTGRSSTPSATTSSRARRLRRVAGVRRADRDDDLQRPPLARDVPGHGPAGRRDDPVRLQHADPLRARPQPGHPAGLPQRAGDAVGGVPERHLGGRRRQGRRRGGRRLAGPVDDRRPERPDRRPGADRRRRAGRRPLRPRLVRPLHSSTLFDFDRYRRPEVYGRITVQRGAIRPE